MESNIPNWLKTAQRGGKWTDEEAQSVVAAWEASGENSRKFAQRHKVTWQRLVFAKRRLSPPSAPVFVPVDVPFKDVQQQQTVSARLTLGALQIEVEDLTQIPPTWLAALMAVCR